MKEKDYDIIKKEIVINASVDKVFLALIDPEQLTQWFPNIATIEQWAGGKVFFRFSKQVTKEKKDHDIIGTIISIIPNKEISYTWNFTTKPEYNKNTIVTWKLAHLDNDKTKITLIHSGFTNLDRIQYDEHNEGWDWYTKRLENFVRD
ncbi:MAG TPA: SRPBCC domain-containing protein [Nitrososphaeraceae archaeon]|nr:SRPBCC domain-containing protein [Nitrososphaeraceae archaeon]